jgi:trehalose synthase
LKITNPSSGLKPVDRILRKAKALQALKVVNFNSTFYGGGVAELLSGMTLLMNSLGIKAEWRVIQGRPDFFNITKKMHNALQGADINLSEIKTSIFEEVNFENAARNRIDHDMVVVHDPQPLPLIDHFPKKVSLALALPYRTPILIAQPGNTSQGSSKNTTR